MTEDDAENALIISVPTAGFGRELAKATIENLAKHGYSLTPVGADLLHYKIRAAAAERIAHEKDIRIEELEAEIEGNNATIQALEAGYRDPDRMREDRDELRRMARDV